MVADVPVQNAVIDGEAVALDEKGKSFAALQAPLGTSERGPGKWAAVEAANRRDAVADPRYDAAGGFPLDRRR